MSFQAYLDTIEMKTGHTPRELIQMAHDRGIAEPPIRAAEVIEWLRDDFGLGRGHAMALVHVLKHGEWIPDTHVGSNGTHRDEANKLRLDGQPDHAPSGQSAHRNGDLS